MNIKLIKKFNIKNEDNNQKQLSNNNKLHNKKEIIDTIIYNLNSDEEKNNINFEKYKNDYINKTKLIRDENKDEYKNVNNTEKKI